MEEFKEQLIKELRFKEMTDKSKIKKREVNNQLEEINKRIGTNEERPEDRLTKHILETT